MDKQNNTIPLSESNVSLRLVDIQRRCSQLMADTDELAGLTLEEPLASADENNPYNRG